MACSPNTSPNYISNDGGYGFSLNFDGSNICIQLTFANIDGLGNQYQINKSYPNTTSILDIIKDIKYDIDINLSSTYLDMWKKGLLIRELLFKAMSS